MAGLVVTSAEGLANSIGVLGSFVGSSHKLGHRVDCKRFGNIRDRLGNNWDCLGNNCHRGNSNSLLMADCSGNLLVDIPADRLGDGLALLHWGADWHLSGDWVALGDRGGGALLLRDAPHIGLASCLRLKPTNLVLDICDNRVADLSGDIIAQRLGETFWDIDTDSVGDTSGDGDSNTVWHISAVGDRDTFGNSNCALNSLGDLGALLVDNLFAYC